MTYKAKIAKIDHEHHLVTVKYKVNETRPLQSKYLDGYQDGLALALSILREGKLC